MEGDDDDMGAIAWPGFVDILSSVIIMFVFFVMVVASALYFHIIIFKNKILSEVAQSTSSQSDAQELAKTNRSLMKKIEEMTEDMKLLEQINQENDIQLYKSDSEFAESQDQDIEENLEEKSVTIFFGNDTISVTKENEDKVNEILQKYIDQFSAPNVMVHITSSKNPNSLNDIVGRRLAVARLLNVRNSILGTDIPPNQIIPTILEKESVDGSYNWVKLEFSKK